MYRIVSGRSVLAILLTFVVLILIIGGVFLSREDGDPFGNDSEKASFFDSLEINVSPKELMRQTVIVPQEFDEVYMKYNELQKRAGYNLEGYRGREIVKYTYEILNNNKADTFVVNVLTYKNRVIGGDISSTSIDGVMLPLKKGIIIGE